LELIIAGCAALGAAAASSLAYGLARSPMQYARPLGEMWASESKGLGRKGLRELLHAEKMEDALRILSSTHYAPFLEGVRTPSELDDALERFLAHEYGRFKGAGPADEIIALLRYKYDFRNLKLLARRLVAGDTAEARYSMLGTIPRERFLQLSSLGDANAAMKSLPPDFARAFGSATAAFNSFGLAAFMEFALDREYFSFMKSRISQRFSFLRDLLCVEADLANILAFTRVKLYYPDEKSISDLLIPFGSLNSNKLAGLFGAGFDQLLDFLRFAQPQYKRILEHGLAEFEKTKSLRHLEKRCLDYYTERIVSAAGFDLFSPKTIAAHLLLKEVEVRNVRIILLAKQENLSPEEISDLVAEPRL